LFLGYMMPPIFYVLFSAIVGPTSATTGILYGITTNSGVIANQLLFFIVLYVLGAKVKLFRDASTVIIMIFVAALVGSFAGNPIGSYVTSYVVTGTGTFPNYFANVNILTAFLGAAVAVSFSGTFLGFAAIAEAAVRRLEKTGNIPPLLAKKALQQTPSEP
jgi:hypothetical protein